MSIRPTFCLGSSDFAQTFFPGSYDRTTWKTTIFSVPAPKGWWGGGVFSLHGCDFSWTYPTLEAHISRLVIPGVNLIAPLESPSKVDSETFIKILKVQSWAFWPKAQLSRKSKSTKGPIKKSEKITMRTFFYAHSIRLTFILGSPHPRGGRGSKILTKFWNFKKLHVIYRLLGFWGRWVRIWT